MTYEVQSLSANAIRGSDSASPLRLYDRARDFVAKSPSQGECFKTEKVIQRIAKELERRKVRL